ncbi:hypothetical protein D3C83_185030 [compost metagenome]
MHDFNLVVETKPGNIVARAGQRAGIGFGGDHARNPAFGEQRRQHAGAGADVEREFP